MFAHHNEIIPLVDSIKIDSFYVVCHFKCRITNTSVVSAVPFEPYEGKIEVLWKDMFLHPLQSYKKYYHTPIKIYSQDTHETILLKAFKQVATKFRWSQEYNQYISA